VARTFTGSGPPRPAASSLTAAQGYPPLLEALGVPDGYQPYGTFMIGYPHERCLRIPVRRPVDVIWH
jgi:hypothetical protein